MSSSARLAAVGLGPFPYKEVSSSEAITATAASAEQEQQARQAAAHAAGLREGEARAQATCEARIAEVRQGIVTALDQFTRDRDKYFLAVERETVQLALAIAAKILHREAQLDPLLLAGMVRVALEQMREAGKVVVRVHPIQAADFRTFFAQQLAENLPEVIEDNTLDQDRCLLETSFGKTEIGPQIQLKEIERGLLDLQAARPR